jgi:hypothetical protein
MLIREVRSVAHQATSRRKLAEAEDRRHVAWAARAASRSMQPLPSKHARIFAAKGSA